MNGQSRAYKEARNHHIVITAHAACDITESLDDIIYIYIS